jgi:hypothetical protein
VTLSLIGAQTPAFAQVPAACLANSHGTLSFASASVEWPDGVELTYRADISPFCMDNTLSIVEQAPQANDERLTFREQYADIAFADMTVNQPRGPLPDGQQDVTISLNTVGDLVQAYG